MSIFGKTMTNAIEFDHWEMAAMLQLAELVRNGLDEASFVEAFKRLQKALDETRAELDLNGAKQ